MGQYYKAVTINKDGELTVYSLQTTEFRKTKDFRLYNGIKLMEHSWVKNSFTEAFSKIIYKNPMQVAWVGDYAYCGGSAYKKLKEMSPDFYDLIWRNEDVDVDCSTDSFDYSNKYLVNHTTKTYIPLNNLTSNSDEWIVYPISLLTAVGNGQGGGDYRGNDEWLVGAWAFDVISIEDEVPEGFVEDDIPYFYE